MSSWDHHVSLMRVNCDQVTNILWGCIVSVENYKPLHSIHGAEYLCLLQNLKDLYNVDSCPHWTQSSAR